MLYYQVTSSNKLTEKVSIIVTQDIDDVSKEDVFIVDIKGEVNQPGVYHMQSQDRILNVIDKAGGLTEQANINSINLSAKVTDEMMIYIPNKLEEISNMDVMAIQKHQGKININQADLSELQTIPGIGVTKAQSILDYRRQHHFRQIEDIKEIEGIGDKMFERIKNKIAV